MLDLRELAQVATAFGVSDEQVRRDHLISHVLTALSDLALPVIFFGGTALARTHLSDPEAGARLSEDIDLYSPQRRASARPPDRTLPTARQCLDTVLRAYAQALEWPPPQDPYD